MSEFLRCGCGRDKCYTKLAVSDSMMGAIAIRITNPYFSEGTAFYLTEKDHGPLYQAFKEILHGEVLENDSTTE